MKGWLAIALVSACCHRGVGTTDFPTAELNAGRSQSVEPAWMIASTNWTPGHEVEHSVCFQLGARQWCGVVKESR